MTRRTSQLTAHVLHEVAAPAGDEGLPRHGNIDDLFGEIISIRPSTPMETTEALRESEARLRALLSSLDDLVFELDEDGVYLAVWTTNEAPERVARPQRPRSNRRRSRQAHDPSRPPRDQNGAPRAFGIPPRGSGGCAMVPGQARPDRRFG